MQEVQRGTPTELEHVKQFDGHVRLCPKVLQERKTKLSEIIARDLFIFRSYSIWSLS
jgi:hypothetical protein